MPTFHNGSIDMYYEELGEGQPVVLIMGLGCPSSLWFNQVPALSSSHRTITFDNRGIGGSSQPAGPYTTELLANDAASLIRGIGAARAHIVGVSMGGTIAQRLAVDHPDVVQKLVLVGTWASTRAFGRELLGAWREIAETSGLETLVRLNLTQYLTPSAFDEQPELIDRLKELLFKGGQQVAGYVAQNRACETHDCLNELDRCEAEALVVAGSRDGQTPVGAAKELVDKIKKAELVMMDGVGHGLVWEDPEPFNELLLDFFSG